MIQFTVHWRIWRSGSQYHFPYICYNHMPLWSYDWSASQLTGHFRSQVVFVSEKRWFKFTILTYPDCFLLCFLFSPGVQLWARLTWTASDKDWQVDAPGKCPTCPEDLLQYLECENCDWFLFQLEVCGNHLPSILFQGNSRPNSKRDYSSYHRLVP